MPIHKLLWSDSKYTQIWSEVQTLFIIVVLIVWFVYKCLLIYSNFTAVATNGQSKGRAALQDYSSGEEDVLSAPPTTSSSIVRRRTSNSSRNVVRSNGHGLARVTVPVTTSTSTSPRLMNYSENEDDEEEEDDEQVQLLSIKLCILLLKKI